MARLHHGRLVDDEGAAPDRLTFALEVELGNDAMQTGADVVDLLRRTADAIEESRGDEEFTADHGNVSDANGNRVGGWTVRRRQGTRP